MLTNEMISWDFNFRHLRAFVHVFELGSIVAASKAVHMSQPALTQAIAGLEAGLDVTLFLREPNGMRPTEAALVLHTRVIRALALIGSTKITQAQARAFTALTREGSYTQASSSTGLSKASLHRCVKDLEIVNGVTLVRRVGRRIDVTLRGRKLARQLNLANVELATGVGELKTMKGVDEARIAIGAMPLCRARVLPASIVKFQATHTSSDIYVAEGSHAELMEPLRDGYLDFLIGALRETSLGADIVQEPLFEDRPVMIAKANHPLFKDKQPVSLESCAEFDWCVPTRGVPLRSRWEQLFSANSLTCPRIRVECGSVIAIRQILLQTDCLTVLSPDQIAVELEAGWLRVLLTLPDNFARTIGVTYRADWRPTETQKAFIETLKEQSRQ